MTEYENLLNSAHEDNITVIENYTFESNRIKGLYSDNVIALNKNIKTEKERKCVLAEELGHHYTSSGNIIDMNNVSNRKQEYHARVIAYRRTFGLTDLISAYKYGCRNCYEIADYLNVTESFLVDAIDHYKTKHGLYAKVDNYLVYFEPLGVLELNMEK